MNGLDPGKSPEPFKEFRSQFLIKIIRRPALELVAVDKLDDLYVSNQITF